MKRVLRDAPTPEGSAEPKPPLWVTYHYTRSVSGAFASISLVVLNFTPEEVRDEIMRMQKAGQWYRFGVLSERPSSVLLFPTTALIDVNIRLATEAEVEQGQNGRS